MPREDVEDQHRAVDDRQRHDLLEILALARTQVVEHQQQLGVALLREFGDLARLAAADQRRRIDGVAALHDAIDDRARRRLRASASNSASSARATSRDRAGLDRDDERALASALPTLRPCGASRSIEPAQCLVISRTGAFEERRVAEVDAVRAHGAQLRQGSRSSTASSRPSGRRRARRAGWRTRFGAVLRRRRPAARRRRSCRRPARSASRCTSVEPAVQIGAAAEHDEDARMRANVRVPRAVRRSARASARSSARRFARCAGQAPIARSSAKIRRNASSSKQHDVEARAAQRFDQRACAGIPTHQSGAARRSPRRRRCDASATRGSAAARGSSVKARDADQLARRADRIEVLGERRHERDDACARAGSTAICGRTRSTADSRAQRSQSTRVDTVSRRKEEAPTSAQSAISTFAREAGLMPARSRHCMRGAARSHCLERMGRPGHRRRSASQDTVANVSRTIASHEGKDCMFPSFVAAIFAADSLPVAVSHRRAPKSARRHQRPQLRVGGASRSHDLRGNAARCRSGDRTVADASHVPGVNVVRYGAFGAARASAFAAARRASPGSGRRPAVRAARSSTSISSSFRSSGIDASKSSKAAGRRFTAPAHRRRDQHHYHAAARPHDATLSPARSANRPISFKRRT